MFFTGIFVLNLVCRDDKLHDQVLIDLKNAFKSVISYKLEEEVNEIIYCQNVEQDMNEWQDVMDKAIRSMNDLLSNESFSQDLIELDDFLKDLKM